jgi:hypothetical protein
MITYLKAKPGDAPPLVKKHVIVFQVVEVAGEEERDVEAAWR